MKTLFLLYIFLISVLPSSAVSQTITDPNSILKDLNDPDVLWFRGLILRHGGEEYFDRKLSEYHDDLQNPRNISVLRKLLQSAFSGTTKLERGEVAMAMNLLITTQSDDAVELVGSFVRQPNLDYRRYAVIALWWLHDKRCVPYLADALKQAEKDFPLTLHPVAVEDQVAWLQSWDQFMFPFRGLCRIKDEEASEAAQEGLSWFRSRFGNGNDPRAAELIDDLETCIKVDFETWIKHHSE